MNLLMQLQQDKPDWNAVRDALLDDPTASSRICTAECQTILHVACEDNAPLSVVQLLVQQFPGAVKRKDRTGSLPLYVACKSNQSFEVIQLLVQAYPHAVKEECSGACLPLHAACMFKQSFEVIQLLVQAYPDAVKQKNSHGFLPLHLACTFNKSFEVIQLLVQEYPDAVKQKNRHGFLPLHFACATKQSFKVIQLLVQEHPFLVKEKDYAGGDTPLDIAKRCMCDVKTVEWLEAIASVPFDVNDSSSLLALTDDVKKPPSPMGLSPSCDEEPDGPSPLPAAKRDDGSPNALVSDKDLANPSVAASNEPERIVKLLLDPGSTIHVATTKKDLHDITACDKSVDRVNKRLYATERGVRTIQLVGGSTIISLSETLVLEDSLPDIISLCSLLEKECEEVD